LTSGALQVNEKGSELRFIVTVAGDAPLGPRRLMLSAHDRPVGFSRVTDGVFLITAPVPVLESVSPQVLVAGQRLVRVTVRGRNLLNVQSVHIEPSADVQIIGPYESNEDGTQLQFLVTVGEDAVSGARAMVVATLAGESPTDIHAGNLVHIARQSGPTYAGIAAPPVGVMVGDAGQGGDVTAVATFVAVPVGVLIPEIETPMVIDRFDASAPVGVVVGGAARVMNPAGWLRGASGTLNISGIGLDAVTAVSVTPPTGLLLGTPTASGDGGSLGLTIAVAPDAADGVRTVRLHKADGGEVVFLDEAAGRIGIGSLPTLFSVAPIVLEQGSVVTLDIRGVNLRGVIGVEALGAPGLHFSNNEISWSTASSSERLLAPLRVDATAAPGDRVLRLLVHGGASAAEAGPHNTLTVAPRP
jgi:hypothetical protein